MTTNGVDPGKAAWRLPAEESFSDWTISIVSIDSEGKKSEKLYHVHSVHLAHGSRRCDYFTKLFATEFKECQKRHSEFEVLPEVAKVFPTFLDFLYDDAVALHRENVFYLCFLADYFGFESLLEVAVRVAATKVIGLENRGELDKYTGFLQSSVHVRLMEEVLLFCKRCDPQSIRMSK